MFLIGSYTLAVLFCIITMICWGSWANTQKLAEQSWRFELFYWDYTIGILLTALIFALTFGSMGEGGRSFIPDLEQASGENIMSALIGGVVFNAANILFVAAISMVGMSVAFPVIIGIALVWGVVVNYLDAPIGNAMVLFIGVAMVAVAILLNASAYRKMAGNAIKVPLVWLILCIGSGILMGYFYNFVASSMFLDFTVPEPGKLSPYTAVFFFAVGIFVSNFIFNPILMMKPPVGDPVSFNAYFLGNFKTHLIGILGGAIWCIGMSFNIIASGTAGPAISYGLGQGATIVAALWGIYIWKEFKGAPQGTGTLLNLMLIFYFIGIGLIILARLI
ncbi:GRP family sugar transporter [soil metagenome]